MLKRALLPSVLVALVLGPSPARAADPVTCATPDPKSGTCLVELPAPSPNPGTEPVGGTPGGGTAPKCTRYPDIAVPCSDPALGFWSNSLEVYCRRTDPQPPPSDPLYEGRTGGAIYDCTDPFGGNFPTGQLWLPQAPGNTISPEEAAQAVVRRMDLRAADIGIVPEDKPGSIGVVGAPVYMWTTPGPTTFGPQVLTASSGGVTITATARVRKIVWDMGDGHSVTCTTPGTPYADAYGFKMSPDCGYKYFKTSARAPGKRYPITATSFWVVDWTGPGGSSGQIPLDLVSRTSLAIGELQALVTK